METFSPDEIAYLDVVFTDLQRAQAAFESYRAHLSRKYSLTPSDQFTRTGQIVRSSPHGTVAHVSDLVNDG